MSRPQHLALAPALLALLLGPPARGREDEAMELARREAERLVAAYNAHDAAAVAAQYAPDGESVVIRGEEVQRRRGRTEIQGSFAQMFSQSPHIKLKLAPGSARMVTPEVYVGEGTWELAGSAASGPSKGRYIAVRRKTGGRWRIVSSYNFSQQAAATE